MIVFRKTPIIRASTLDVSLSLSLSTHAEKRREKKEIAPRLPRNGQRSKFPRELLEASVGCIPGKMGRALALSPIRMGMFAEL